MPHVLFAFLFIACVSCAAATTPPPSRSPHAPPVATASPSPPAKPPTPHKAASWESVLHAQIAPHWLPDGTHFYFTDDSGPAGRSLVLVDALTGDRSPAYDPARLATALAAALGSEVPPERQKMSELRLDGASGGTLRFIAAGKGWRCDLRTYVVTEDAAALRPPTDLLDAGDVHATVRTGHPVALSLTNRTHGALTMDWMDFGHERRKYSDVAPGATVVQHTYEGHIWVVTDAKGGVLAAFETPDGGGAFIIDDAMVARANVAKSEGEVSPDGRTLAFVKDHQVFLRAAKDRTPKPIALTHDGTADASYADDNLYWSPDSTRLVAIRTRKGEDRKVYLIESSPPDQLQPKRSSYDYLKPGDRVPVDEVHLFDVAARTPIAVSDALFPTPFALSDYRWSDDSTQFGFIYNQRGHQRLRVLSVDAKSGAVRTVIEETSKTFIDYSGKTFLRALPATHEMVWMSERDGWNHLYLYDSATGVVKNPITHGEWAVREVESVDAAQRQIWFLAGGVRPEQDPYYVHLCRVNFDGSGFVVLTEGDGTHSVAFSPDRRFFLDTWSRVDQPPVFELRRATDGSLVREIGRADIHLLLESGWRSPERFVAKGRDGRTDIYGIVVRPTDFDPAKTYPVIEDIYAGPQGARVQKSFDLEETDRALADHGFIVVQIDGMGTSFRSKSFHDVAWKNLADAGFPDRIAWMKSAAAKHREMDLARVGIFGGSAGGQNAMRALLSHGEFYKVAVADSGCHDNRMDKIWWNEQWMGWPVDDSYAKSSNVVDAHLLTGKLLLIVGELDHNVDPSSTMQVVNALIKADKDFDLLVVPGGGHGIAESPYGSRRRADFFVQHLLGAER